MTRTKEPVAPPFDPWAEYQRLQLTPEEKTAGRDEALKLGQEAARNGVYQKLLELEGKVPLDWRFYQRLREDED
jgi:hypothetical protein